MEMGQLTKRDYANFLDDLFIGLMALCLGIKAEEEPTPTGSLLTHRLKRPKSSIHKLTYSANLILVSMAGILSVQWAGSCLIRKFILVVGSGRLLDG
jgi:hypothetical protein